MLLRAFRLQLLVLLGLSDLSERAEMGLTGAGEAVPSIGNKDLLVLALLGGLLERESSLELSEEFSSPSSTKKP